MIELCQNIVGSVFRQRPSTGYLSMETTQLVLSQGQGGPSLLEFRVSRTLLCVNIVNL